MPGFLKAHDQILQGIFAELLELTERGPVVVAVDDIGHTDPASLHCLLYMARRLGSSRIMVVVTESFRLKPAYLLFRAELLRYPFFSSLSLPPLSVQGVAQLMETPLGAAASLRLARECFMATGGNPLLVHAIIDDQKPPVDGADAGGPASLRMGDNFALAVVGCLYRHDELVRSVARALAIFAGSAQPALIGQLQDITPELAAQAIHILETSGLVNAGRFRHPKILHAIVNDMPPDGLSQLHQRAAELLYRDGATPTLIAAHLVKASCGDAPWTVSVLRDAAERALTAGEPEFASSCLQLAIRSAADYRERAVTTTMLVRAQWQVNPLAVVGHLGELTEAVRTGRLPAREELAIVPYLLWYGKVDDAAGALGRAAASRDLLDASATAQLRAVQLLISWFNPKHMITVEEPSDSSATPAGADPSVNPQLQAVTVLGRAMTKAFDADVCGADQILQRCELEPAAFGPVAAALGALVCAGRSDHAAVWGDMFIHRPLLRNAPAWRAILQAIRAEAAIRVGDLAVAEDYARSALAGMPPEAWGVAIGLPLATVLLAATETGNFDKASDYLTVPVPQSMLHTPVGLLHLRARGRYHLATGRHQAALSDFQSCADVMSNRRCDWPALLSWRLEMARAQICLGRTYAAARLATEQLQDTTGLDGCTYGQALRLLAATAAPLQRTALLKEAVAVLEGCNDRVELAHALADLGHAMQSQGDSGRARMMTRRAYQLAQTCGAWLLCSRLILDKPGVGPPDSCTSASDDAVGRLSDAERRVAAQAAQGLTNREIADKLFITVSTVEQHLTRVFKKLEIKHRVDLPVGLADHGEVWVRRALPAARRIPVPQVTPVRRLSERCQPAPVSFGGRA